MENQKIFSPNSLDDCLNLISRQPEAKLLAGGTDLLVRLKDGLALPPIINLSYIDELKGISVSDDNIRVGALTTFSEIIENDAVEKYANVLKQAAEIIGSPQIRNRATIGGNIANASPAGDSIPPLFVLDAMIEINGERTVPINEFFNGPGKTVLRTGEIISSVVIPKTENMRGAFTRLGQRKSLAISKVSLAALLNIEDGKILEARIALGAVAPTVVRASQTEKFLIGKILNNETILQAQKIICEEVNPISDIRSVAEYRKEMCGELLEQAITELLIL